MNPTKIKYAVERAKRIYQAKCDSVKSDRVQLSDREMRAALKAGKFKLKPLSDGRLYYLRDVIAFDAEAGNEAKEKDRQAQIKKFDATYADLKDQIYLGDEAEALQLLKNFEAAL